MIYLLHGDDTAQSRKFLSGLAENFKVITLDGKTLTVPVLEENLLSQGLFGDQKIVVVENLLSKNAGKKKLISFINENEHDTQLILWEDKKIFKTTTNSLKNITIREFMLPTYYFQFLDQLSPPNKKKVFILYQQLLKTYAPEQLLFSLIKRVRLLVILKSQSTTDEITKMPPWMLSKLQQQARLWPRDTLILFYKKLQEADIKLKTGRLPTDLSKHLDIVILSQL